MINYIFVYKQVPVTKTLHTGTYTNHYKQQIYYYNKYLFSMEFYMIIIQVFTI